jgi:arginase
MRQSHIAIIGAPMDLGADRRGVDMGPSAMRLAHLNERIASLGYEVKDYGNITVEQPESVPEGPEKARYLPQIAHTCERLAEMVEKAAEDGMVPLVLGGDHSIASGTVAGIASFYRKQNKKIGLI